MVLLHQLFHQGEMNDGSHHKPLLKSIFWVKELLVKGVVPSPSSGRPILLQKLYQILIYKSMDAVHLSSPPPSISCEYFPQSVVATPFFGNVERKACSNLRMTRAHWGRISAAWVLHNFPRVDRRWVQCRVTIPFWRENGIRGPRSAVLGVILKDSTL